MKLNELQAHAVNYKEDAKRLGRKEFDAQEFPVILELKVGNEELLVKDNGFAKYSDERCGKIRSTVFSIFITINTIPKEHLQIVSSFFCRATISSGDVYQMVLSVVLDKTKAETDCCEFPVYIPAKGNYKQEQHQKLLEQFRDGNPFVAVECKNFRLYRTDNNGAYSYFAHADSFKVVDYSKILED